MANRSAKGIVSDELRAVTHEFVAIKRSFTSLRVCRPIAYWSMGKTGLVLHESRSLFNGIRGLPG